MSQYNFGNLSSPLSGADLIDTHLEPWRNALHSLHSGSSRPSYAVAQMMWIDTSATPWVLKVFDGSDDITIGTINATTNVFTPAGLSASAYMQTLLDDPDATTARNTLGLVIGADVQAYSAKTAALAGLTWANNKLPYFTGTSSADMVDTTSFGRSLLNAADAAALRTLAALGSAATLTAGTSANNLVQLNGSAQLPAVDGSLLTGLAGGTVIRSGAILTNNTASFEDFTWSNGAYRRIFIEIQDFRVGNSGGSDRPNLRLINNGTVLTASNYRNVIRSETTTTANLHVTNQWPIGDDLGVRNSTGYSATIWIENLDTIPIIRGNIWDVEGSKLLTINGAYTSAISQMSGIRLLTTGSRNLSNVTKLKITGFA